MKKFISLLIFSFALLFFSGCGTKIPKFDPNTEYGFRINETDPKFIWKIRQKILLEFIHLEIPVFWMGC